MKPPERDRMPTRPGLIIHAACARKPTLACPGVMIPLVFGPTMRTPAARASFRIRTLSCSGMPSVTTCAHDGRTASTSRMALT